MKKLNVTKQMLMVLLGLTLVVFSCSDNEPIENLEQDPSSTEVALSAEMDVALETMDDIAIDAYEAQEANENSTSRTTNENGFFTLPDCVTITVVAEQNFRELTIDFGTEGCEVRNNILKGKIILSYTRNPEAREVLISKTLEDFYFNDKSIIGSKTILRERSNENENPQYTKTLDLTVVWPDGTEASRTGTKIREWVEGHGSGVWSDNVFEVTGNWTSVFRNGNTHAYEVTNPLRREMICRFFVSGSVDVQRTHFSGVFDYGDGECDNQATFTFEDGTVRDITLR
ncbi:hypothetical protein [Pontimicrobium aquaticum]|uniref:Lipoprotein n=1 Tax=Pontimicrobium aquaticum TaxID=2565367 RepID=A0A4U0EX10_9FLAO|nr:hypothetical protein [Pontimicrobium aquaticum]TJY36485.1 hypothetical protein E5167_07440 [Pontimicrobium aquaticum]